MREINDKSDYDQKPTSIETEWPRFVCETRNIHGALIFIGNMKTQQSWETILQSDLIFLVSIKFTKICKEISIFKLITVWKGYNINDKNANKGRISSFLL